MNKCKLCGKKYEVHGWNFYNLCDVCFEPFSKWRQGKYSRGYTADEWIGIVRKTNRMVES